MRLFERHLVPQVYFLAERFRSMRQTLWFGAVKKGYLQLFLVDVVGS